MEDKIKPCPFCGGASEVKHYENMIDGQPFTLFIVQCVSLCGANTWQGDETSARIAWNNRSEELFPAELGDRCRSIAAEVLGCAYKQNKPNDYRLRIETYHKLCRILDEVANINNSPKERARGTK